MLLDRLDPEYKRLLEEIAPSQISYSGIQAVLKLLLAERISIRNLHLVLEAIAEIAPHVRRAEQLAEHVRMRLAQQICGDLADGGVLKVLRLGNRWDLAFHQSLKRDAKGDVVEFDIDPRLIEQFSTEASKVDPRPHGPGPPVRARGGARCQALRAHGDGAAVRDAARALPRRDRARRRRSSRSARSHESDRPGDRARGLPAVLPYRRLPDADARLFQRARAGAGAPVHCVVRDACALADARAGAAPDPRQPALGQGAFADRFRGRDRRADRHHGARLLPWPCSSWRSRRRCSSASARCRAPPSRTPSRCRRWPRSSL